MKQKITLKKLQTEDLILLFICGLGTGYEIVRDILSPKNQSSMMWVLVCLLVARIASKQRKKYITK